MWYQSCSLLWPGSDKQWNGEPLGNMSKHFEAFFPLKIPFDPFFFCQRQMLSWSLISFQVYWLGPMCGGIAAALIYDFLLYPRAQNFSVRRNVLLNGGEGENDAVEISGEGSSSPGPSEWPKHWTIFNFSVCQHIIFLFLQLFLSCVYF